MKIWQKCRKWVWLAVGLAVLLFHLPLVYTVWTAYMTRHEYNLRDWCAIPLQTVRLGESGNEWNPLRTIEGGGFDMATTPVAVWEFAWFLTDTGCESFPSAQLRRHDDGDWWGLPGRAKQAMVNVSLAEATAYCEWLSARIGRAVRLPTEDEWETAARGGLDQAPYPWGWSAPPAWVWFAKTDVSRFARTGRSNGYGLHAMAGNVAEWCMPSPGLPVPAGQRPIRGGSWAERDPAMLRVAARAFVAEDYRDRDVGFRVCREWPPAEDSAAAEE